MRVISPAKYSELYTTANYGTNENETLLQLKEVLAKKASGIKCEVCGGEVWAVGMFLAGWNGCHFCITGEDDSSNDFEIE